MTGTEHLLSLISHEPRLLEEEISQAYTKYLREPETDWPTVNRAIIARYSMTAFKRIKKAAWK